VINRAVAELTAALERVTAPPRQIAEKAGEHPDQTLTESPPTEVKSRG
jgi:hypothetical protein